MIHDKSVLLQMEEQGHTASRVRLKGTERNDDASERYQIVGELARGGAGVVHVGRDNDVGRDVALKVLHDEHLRVSDLVQRFVEEAQIGGQLQHPGIVPVYELGLQADKRPFFAMKLVKGETLTDKLAARKDPAERLRGLLRVFRDVCRTLAYAHTRGVIHRDLKPSNIMIGNFGEVQVVDWGFAKVMRKGGVHDERLSEKVKRDETMVSTVRSGEGNADSVAGLVMGTPAYMPPEQALGRVEELDEKSDLFSLGAILAEILTGRPPYEGGATDCMTAAAHARLDPVRERLRRCGADPRLVALCAQCLEPSPKDRPACAEVLADEVAAYLTSVETRAHRAQLRALKAEAEADEQRLKRRQTMLVGGSALFAVLIAVGAYLLIDTARTKRENERNAAIESALQDAERLRAAQQWPAALAAAERAMGLGHEGALVSEIGAEAEEATLRAKRAAEDDEFLAELEGIRGRWGQGEVEAGDDPRVMDAAYVAAFERRFGTIDAGLERLAASRNASAFAANLGFWRWLRRTQPSLNDSDWEQVDRLSRALDPGNADVRDAVSASDAEALLVIARERGNSLPLALVPQVGLALMADHPAEAVFFLKAQHRRDPRDFWINYGLGMAGSRIADYQLATSHYTAALAVEPERPWAWMSLGSALSRAGELEDAVVAYRKAVELDPTDAGAEAGLARAEQAAALQRRLAAILAGREQPADGREALTFAELALVQHQDYAGALRLYRQAFEANPEIAADPSNGVRYDAACAASLAGKTEHAQALEWLRADLELWEKAVAQNAEAVAQALEHWQKDPNLTLIRDAKEQPDEFKRLWADVDALLKRALR